jgi:hypothetical protein
MDGTIQDNLLQEPEGRRGLAILTAVRGREVPRLSWPTGTSASTLRQLIAAAAAMDAPLTATAAPGSAALALGGLNGGGHGLESGRD